MVAGRKRWLKLRHAFGLKAPGGRPPKVTAERLTEWQQQQQQALALLQGAERQIEEWLSRLAGGRGTNLKF